MRCFPSIVSEVSSKSCVLGTLSRLLSYRLLCLFSSCDKVLDSLRFYRDLQRSATSSIMFISLRTLLILAFAIVCIVSLAVSAERAAWTEVTFGGRTFSLPRSYFDGRSDEPHGRYHAIYSRKEGSPPEFVANEHGGVEWNRQVVGQLHDHEYRQMQKHEFDQAVEVENQRRVENSWKAAHRCSRAVVGRLSTSSWTSGRSWYRYRRAGRATLSRQDAGTTG